MEKLIIITGATATGKTKISVQLAKKINGEIICCDSMQIYKNMDIGTAKVTPAEMQGVKHHMIDIVSPSENYSVADYVKQVRLLISSIIKQGKQPILVGGTGLYIHSLIYPTSVNEDMCDSQIKLDLQNKLEQFGKEYLHNLLKEVDPIEANKVHFNNVKRVLRDLEIFYSSGVKKSDMHDDKKPLLYDVDMYILCAERELLYDRINRRVDIMFKNGLADEVKKLVESGLKFESQAMQGIGYKEFYGYFYNGEKIEDVINLVKQNSRHYAKRQITWFKKYDFAKWIDINDADTILDFYK